MKNLKPADEQGIRDQRTMTTPRNRFGAHEGDPFPLGQPYQGLKIFNELPRLHIIGKTAERGIAPGRIDRIGLGVT